MRILALVALAACGTAPVADGPDAAAAVSPFGADFLDQVGQSGWVFRARVVEVPAADRITVEIEQSSLEPLEAPLPAGSRDTVILAAGSAFAVGDEAYFLTSWISAGTSWTFTEIGHLDGGLDFDTVHRAVHLAHRYWIDRALADRLAGSPRVLHATVTAIEPSAGPTSESGPDWWQATLSPWHTLRGAVSIDPTTVRFDASGNECCWQWPKLHVGDQAIYLLQADPDGPVLDDALDRQELTELERVRSLLASPPVPPTL